MTHLRPSPLPVHVQRHLGLGNLVLRSVHGVQSGALPFILSHSYSVMQHVIPLFEIPPDLISGPDLISIVRIHVYTSTRITHPQIPSTRMTGRMYICLDAHSDAKFGFPGGCDPLCAGNNTHS